MTTTHLNLPTLQVVFAAILVFGAACVQSGDKLDDGTSSSTMGQDTGDGVSASETGAGSGTGAGTRTTSTAGPGTGETSGDGSDTMGGPTTPECVQRPNFRCRHGLTCEAREALRVTCGDWLNAPFDPDGCYSEPCDAADGETQGTCPDGFACVMSPPAGCRGGWVCEENEAGECVCKSTGEEDCDRWCVPRELVDPGWTTGDTGSTGEAPPDGTGGTSGATG